MSDELGSYERMTDLERREFLRNLYNGKPTPESQIESLQRALAEANAKLASRPIPAQVEALPAKLERVLRLHHTDKCDYCCVFNEHDQVCPELIADLEAALAQSAPVSRGVERSESQIRPLKLLPNGEDFTGVCPTCGVDWDSTILRDQIDELMLKNSRQSVKIAELERQAASPEGHDEPVR